MGARWKIDELSVLANSFAVLAFLRIVLANFAVVEVSYFNVKAVISILLAASLLYAASRWISFPSLGRTYKIPEAYTWVATFVVALLAWYQLWPASVALGWALIGLVLFQLGYVQRSASFRLQSYLLFMASFFRVFFVNFNAEQSPGLLSPRLYTALPLALLFYFVYGRLERDPEAFLATDTRLKAAQLHCLMGTIVVAAAMRFELSPDWIAAAWAGLVCIFVLIAWRLGRRIFLGQALLLAAAVFFRTLMHNFYQRSYFPAPFLFVGRLDDHGDRRPAVVCRPAHRAAIESCAVRKAPPKKARSGAPSPPSIAIRCTFSFLPPSFCSRAYSLWNCVRAAWPRWPGAQRLWQFSCLPSRLRSGSFA